MARAKRTVRTDARRRYRAEQAAMGIEPTGESAEAADEPSSSRGRGASTGGSSPAVARPSITGSIRGAVRPLDVRGDIRALPQVAIHWSVLAVAGVAIAATAAFIVATNEFGASLDFSLSQPLGGKTVPGLTTATYFIITMFVAPPPAAGGFVIGFFAKRASWLTGLLFGIVSAACYSVLVVSPAGRLIIGDSDPGIFVVQAWIIGPIGAALFASAAAWYRRFLQLANPGGGRRPPRPQQGRGGSRPKDRPVAAARRR